MEDCCGHYYQTKPGGETRGDWSLAVAWQLALNASLIELSRSRQSSQSFILFLQEMDLGSIFSLLVSAGFPKVCLTCELMLCTFCESLPRCTQLPREGSVLCKTSVEEGTTRAVLTSVTPSGGTLQGLAVDLTTRESKAVRVV